MNPENLTLEEINYKITYLENSIRSVSAGLCENRTERIKLLKLYLNQDSKK